METRPKSEDVARDVLRQAGARECRRCGQQSSVPARSRDDGHDGQTWFCVECGHEEN